MNAFEKKFLKSFWMNKILFDEASTITLTSIASQVSQRRKFLKQQQDELDPLFPDDVGSEPVARRQHAIVRFLLQHETRQEDLSSLDRTRSTHAPLLQKVQNVALGSLFSRCTIGAECPFHSKYPFGSKYAVSPESAIGSQYTVGSCSAFTS
jgi:hypothetical protein